MKSGFIFSSLFSEGPVAKWSIIKTNALKALFRWKNRRKWRKFLCKWVLKYEICVFSSGLREKEINGYYKNSSLDLILTTLKYQTSYNKLIVKELFRLKCTHDFYFKNSLIWNLPYLTNLLRIQVKYFFFFSLNENR